MKIEKKLLTYIPNTQQPIANPHIKPPHPFVIQSNLKKIRMKKTLAVFLFALASLLFARAQNVIISGQLADPAGQPVIGANVVLLQPADSALIKGTTSDIDGNFELEAPARGRFLIKISYIGYEDIFLPAALRGEPLLLGRLILKEQSVKLNEVDVTGTVLPVQQKGDTTQINAGAFKTNPDASAEDLVTKMPGITVQDGKVQAQGEDVRRVLVDGRDFFGDDANAVLKNLPAEVIDKIQIFDKKSDQSELTGFDDGNTSKTINIITKMQFRNGIFGRAQGGYGYEDKWKGGLSLNFFDDSRRITLLGNSNNINDQNFSSEDLLGVMGSNSGGQGRRGGGRRGGGQGGDAGNFLVDQKSGLTVTHSAGLNYADQWGKLDFTGSYFFNYSDNSATGDLFRQYFTDEGEGLAYDEHSENDSRNLNHRLNMKFDWKVDSFNTLRFQPRLSVQQNDGNNFLLGENSEAAELLSSTLNTSASDLAGFNFSAPLLYRHIFGKKGRTFSINLTPGYNQNKGDSRLDANTSFFSDTLSAEMLNQLSNRNVQGFTLASNLTYTEPLSDKSQLMLNYGSNFNKNDSDKETFNYSAADDSYNAFDTTLSNKFNNTYLSQSLGATYRYQQAKWNLSAGLAYQYAQLKGEQVFPEAFDLNKVFHSLLPNAQFQYKFSNKENLRISYRSRNDAPSVSQLQNVINNDNPLQLRTGNPNLKQDWQNGLTLRYSSANTEKSQSFFALLSGTYTQNYIVNSTIIAEQDTLLAPGIILAKGAQISSPVNLDGYFNLRTFSNYSLPLPAIKSNLSLNLGGAFSKTPGLINGEKNAANSYNVGLGFVLSSNISEKADFTLSSNTTYNNISNSLQSDLNSDYYNQNTRFKIQVIPFGGLVLQTDLSHQYNSGLSQNYNQNYLLWNAAIGYKFLNAQAGELRLAIFDILRQNNSIARNTTETYYEDVQTNVLQQFLLLTFTYNLKYFKNGK